MVEKFSMVVVAITMSGIVFAVFQEPVRIIAFISAALFDSRRRSTMRSYR